MVVSFPDLLTKDVANSLAPKLEYLTNAMGRTIDDAVAYPEFFSYSLKRRIEPRYKRLTEHNVTSFTLSNLLSGNDRKFYSRFGVATLPANLVPGLSFA